MSLDNLGLAPDLERWSDFWPVIFVFIGIGEVFSGSTVRGLFHLVLGVVLLLPAIVPGITWGDLWQRWPLFLIAFGVYLLLGGKGRKRRHAANDNRSFITAFGAFSRARHRIASPSFEGGDMAAFLGACEIDLTQSELAEQGAVIDVFAFWGGIEIRVPKHWGLELQVTPFMGGAENRTKQVAEPGSPCLVVNGFVMMGGIDVLN